MTSLPPGFVLRGGSVTLASGPSGQLGDAPVDTTDCKTYVPILPTVVWPSTAHAYIGEIDADYKAFDIDVKASAVSASYKQQWAAQLAAWNKFRDDNAGWFYFGAAATMDQTDRYACALRAYRAAFIAQGGKPTSPGPVAPGQGVPPSNPTDTTGWLTTMGYIALGLGGVYLAVQVIKLVPTAAERAAREPRASLPPEPADAVPAAA
jgi:hypothetical protein